MTLKELRDYIRLVTLIEDTNVTDAQVNRLINIGLHEVSTAFPWAWLETSTDLSLTEDVRWIDLPDNYDYGIVLVDDDFDEALDHISTKRFFEIVGNDTGNESANPRFWTIFDGKIYVHPIPNANDADRYTLYYYSEVSDLTLDSDEPEFHEGYHWILVEFCKWKLFDREEYFDQAERAFIAYSRYLNDMIAFYGSPIKKSPFLWGDGRHGRRGDPNIPSLNDF